MDTVIMFGLLQVNAEGEPPHKRQRAAFGNLTNVSIVAAFSIDSG